MQHAANGKGLASPRAARRRTQSRWPARKPLPPGDGDPGPHRSALSVGFILAPYFSLLSFSCFVEALKHARREGGRSCEAECRWTIMASSPEPVISSCSSEVVPTSPYLDPREFDYIVVVGGDLDQTPQPDAEMAAYLRRAAALKVPLAGICTGSFILAQAGLLKGRQCCVHWYHYQAFVSRFPELASTIDKLFVADRDRITCVGGVAVVDLAAFLIERHFGKDRSHRALVLMTADGPRSPSWVPPHFSHMTGDIRVRKAMMLMAQNVSNPLRVTDLAKAVNMSVRQFERVFHATVGASPREYCRLSRLKHGRKLLASTRMPIALIAYECGFADSPHFCRHFKQLLGVTPSAFRVGMRHGGRGLPPTARRASDDADVALL